MLTATVALPGAGPRDLEFFNVLFAVSLVILLTNFIARAAISVRAFLKYRSFINTGKEWAQFAFSVVLSQIEPHNSLLYLNSVFADEKPLTDVVSLEPDQPLTPGARRPWTHALRPSPSSVMQRHLLKVEARMTDIAVTM